MIVEVVNKSLNDLPIYATQDSAAMDLKANLTDENLKAIRQKSIQVFVGSINGGQGSRVVLYPGERVLIPTDLFMAIPKGYVLDIRARSGLALKDGISLVNGVGTIDSDYRGNVGVILINHSDKPFIINHGDRIAQAVLLKHEIIEWKNVETLPETVRGQGGFGHTGK